MPIIAENAKNQRVRDKQGNLVKGNFGIGLGAVFCSFRKELSPLQGYEMWTRVLSWDRKWLYLITYFVVKGKVRPTGWDGAHMGPTRSRRKVVMSKEQREVDGNADAVEGFEKYVVATAISKYVFKLGRFTVHPALLIEASGLLPERPGVGWTNEGENGSGTPEQLGGLEELDGLDELDETRKWDWRNIEAERRRGLKYAEHFAALDGTGSLFDGGEDGAIGKFPLG